MRPLPLALLAGILVLGACRKPTVQSGQASWYGPGFRGKPTASGEKFRPGKRTAAHKTLPFGTILKVENQTNGRQVKVVVNDRGPYAGDRVLDLSKGAAKRIGLIDQGVGRVEFRVTGCKKRYERCE